MVKDRLLMPTGGGLRRRSFHRDNNGTTAIEPTKIYCKYFCESLDGTCGSAYPKGFFLFLLWKQ